MSVSSEETVPSSPSTQEETYFLRPTCRTQTGGSGISESERWDERPHTCAEA